MLCRPASSFSEEDLGMEEGKLNSGEDGEESDGEISETEG